MRRLALFFWLGFFCLVAGCRDQRPPAPPETLILGVTRGPYALLIDLAQKENFFAGHGLQVEIREYDSGYDAIRQVGRELDLACAPEYAFVVRSFQDPALRVFASVAESDIHELVVRRDLGIATLGDLRGRTVGLTANTAGEFFLGSFLLFEGELSLADVRTVDLPQRELVAALQRGEVAAAVLGGTELLTAKRLLGEKVVGWPAQWGLGFFWCLVTDATRLATRPQTFERFLRALLQAEEYLRRQPAVARTLLQNQFASAAEIAAVLARIDFYVTLNQSLMVAMEEEGEWVKLGPVPNYLQRMAPEPLQAVAPERMNIFR